MKFLEAFKDSSGFHFVVQLNDGTDKHFNYGFQPAGFLTGQLVPHPDGLETPDPSGKTIPDPAGGLMPDPSGATFEDPKDLFEGEPEVVDVGTGKFDQHGQELTQKTTVRKKLPRVKPVMVPKQIPVMVPVMVPEVIQETDEQYIARIEAEIIATCRNLNNPVSADLSSKGKEF